VRTSGRFDGGVVAPNEQQKELAPLTTGETRQVVAEFFKQQAPGVSQPRLEFRGEPRPSPIEDPSRITVGAPMQRGEGDTTGMPSAASDTQSESRDGSAAQGMAPRMEELAPEMGPTRFVQLHNTYIVAETSEGVVIIDQHALHERIIYEELFARAMRGPLEGQRLLIPEVLPLLPRQAAALETVKPLLLKLGMEITDFDAGSVAVHSFPSLLSKVSPREFLRELLDRLMEYGGAGASKLTPEELLHEVLDMASCKAAVKAGYPLSQEEIAALLMRKTQVERSSNCPHGRPTTLRLTISDLERQFKRK